MPRADDTRVRRKKLLSGLSAAAPMFAALGDATRLRIVMRLRHDGPKSITHLTQGANISRQAVTKHLRALQQVQLVGSARSGREHIWELRQQKLGELRGYIDQIAGQWDGALERLRTLVES
jgi:DNA-binding transcriptional ArsR family regulator